MPEHKQAGRGLLLLLVGCGFLAACQGGPHTAAWMQRPLASGPDIKVRILRKTPFTRIRIEWRQPVDVLDGEGQTIALPPGEHQLQCRKIGDLVEVIFSSSPAGTKPLRTRSVRLRSEGVGIFKHAIPSRGFSREYEASEIRIGVKYSRLAVIHQLPLELYLSRVLPAEMDPDHFTLEALKSQAVVARTWALANLNRHRRFGYNFCDGPHCQVYRGRRLVSQRAERAVKMTLGEVLNYQGRLAEAFYHSTCGGNTAFVDEVWGGRPLPYLVRVEDHWQPNGRPYCIRSPFARWRVITSLRRVERALRTQGVLERRERLEDVQVDFVNRSGRVRRILLTTDLRRVRLGAKEFARAVNTLSPRRQILSQSYEIHVHGGQFHLLGRGLGHGVGMCQWGARGMAQHGFDYRAILEHYFPGTQLAIYPKAQREEETESLSTTQNSPAGTK